MYQCLALPPAEESHLGPTYVALIPRRLALLNWSAHIINALSIREKRISSWPPLQSTGGWKLMVMSDWSLKMKSRLEDDAHWDIGVNPGGFGGSRPPQILARMGRGGRRGRGRAVKYYQILSCMYRKYVRKWWLLKRNRIICLEIAVNSQRFPRISTFL